MARLLKLSLIDDCLVAAETYFTVKWKRNILDQKKLLYNQKNCDANITLSHEIIGNIIHWKQDNNTFMREWKKLEY